MPRHVALIFGSLFVSMVLLPVPRLEAMTISESSDCPCLVHGGEPGSGDCVCDVGSCYQRCVEELCPSYPQCMLECSRRCYCPTQSAFRCPDHVDPGPTPTAGPVCPGDCNSDGRVTVDELVQSVLVLLIEPLKADCANLDWNRDEEVTIHEVIKAVNTALFGCVRVLR